MTFHGQPNPGSDDAIDFGCTCPVIDNGHGNGYHYVEGREPEFVVTSGCPLHAVPAMDALLGALGYGKKVEAKP